ncbi:MAG: polyphosphate kinase 1 [Bacteroidaceae bacterium]|jgi:polyphosphate kinase
MEPQYEYFNRDISWLSFNYRVLLEADDESLPLYERIKFISIYSSNLEEFYKVRVADLRASISGSRAVEESADEQEQVLEAITREVNRQLDERVRIYERRILPALEAEGIGFYQSPEVGEEHKSFVRSFFLEEVFPFLQPVVVQKGRVRSFLREGRLYLAVRLRPKGAEAAGWEYFVLKIPYSKVPRFVELPAAGRKACFMFLEDVVAANLDVIFPGYDVESSYSIKISRDADIMIEDNVPGGIVEQMKRKLRKRKIGAVCRFVYDRRMPLDFLEALMDAFGITQDDLVEGDHHLNLEDLGHLPCPEERLKFSAPPHVPLPFMKKGRHPVFTEVARRDLLLYYPYHSFDPFIHWLYEAVHDPEVKEILITQYRVAENSTVINTLISAAQNGKEVTVFVELKARFDEAHNLATAELMQRFGVHIIYSIPKLKVHAKVALILRENEQGKSGYAYVGTGNFNEQTAEVYADLGLFTCNEEIVADLHALFSYLRCPEGEPVFRRLLVPPFNLVSTLERLIRREIEVARGGGRGRIVLKMNALQERGMIDLLYEASQAGVEIDLIVRGICCLVPGRPFSRHIRVTRIVDSFLEHARIWYFGAGGEPELYMGSPDFMRRNLYRRIEVITPVLDGELKKMLTHLLKIQLLPGRKACWVDEHLHNCFKDDDPRNTVRVQHAVREYLVSCGKTLLGRAKGAPLPDERL